MKSVMVWVVVAGCFLTIGNQGFAEGGEGQADQVRQPSSLQNALNQEAEENHNSAFTKEYQDKINGQNQGDQDAESQSAADKARHERMMNHAFPRGM